MNYGMRILIVGGVAGGASAATRARRLSEPAEIILFERGEYVSFANCGLPYHIGGVIPDRKRLLVQTAEGLRRRYRIDVRIKTEVIKIEPGAKSIVARDLVTGNEYTESYDFLILSPGAYPFVPPLEGIPHERVFTLRTMKDMDGIIDGLGNAQKALVVGGGYIGLEMTEALRNRNLAVTLIELEAQVMVTADPEMTTPIKQQLAQNCVDLRLRTSIIGVAETPTGIAARLSTGEMVGGDILILNIGVRPESRLAREAGLALGPRAGIIVDDQMRTSDPFIFAIGDAVEVPDLVGGYSTLIPLAGPANRQGRIAADTIFGRPCMYRKSQGTAICKIFDLTIAMTGLNEKTLKKIGRRYEKIYVHPADHASYYPGATPVSLKLLFDPDNGTILGAQAVGLKGIDKRIDVLAVAMRAGLTVFDLEHLELSYAPPFSSAKDPVNYAGFVAGNVLRGDVKLCHFEDVNNPREDQLILDVRTIPEVAEGTIPGAVCIPIDELRDRLDELPRDKELLVTCQVGQRGYIACRILTQNGFSCRNLTGGYMTYLAFIDSIRETELVETELRDDTGEIGLSSPAGE